jgi:hypothetical protein
MYSGGYRFETQHKRQVSPQIEDLLGFNQSLQVTTRIDPQIRQRPHLSTSFRLQLSLPILQLDAVLAAETLNKA